MQSLRSILANIPIRIGHFFYHENSDPQEVTGAAQLLTVDLCWIIDEQAGGSKSLFHPLLR